MTKPYRRDADTKNGSVITGLRLEKALAQRLIDVAREDASQRGEFNLRTQRPVADATRQVRLLLRLAVLGGASEDPTDQGPQVVLGAGLKTEPTLAAAVRATAASLQMGTAACIRHLLRTHLGWTHQESLAIERQFSTIAKRKRQLYTQAI